MRHTHTQLTLSENTLYDTVGTRTFSIEKFKIKRKDETLCP